MNIYEFAQGIFYIGVNDRTTEKFESLWSLPNGVSYNSYLVKGDNKIALIDTVHASLSLKYLDNIKSIIGDSTVDYLIINHMEPDHSGAISLIKSIYPGIKIIGNTKTAGMIEGYYGITENVVSINDGDELDLGGKKLKFIFTPMVHWPETMMTIEQQAGVLFSGDAFGCYGALNGGIVDQELDVDTYIDEAYRYYSNIVAKYGIFVAKALQKLEGIKLNYICATHGPIWHEQVRRIVDTYTRLCHWESEEGVVIAYGSMYGNTQEMVERIARQLALQGIKQIKIYNLSKADLSYVLSDICRYKGLVIASPTYSMGIFPPVAALVEALKTREIKERVVAYFGSYTWAPMATKKLAEILQGMKVTLIGDSFDLKQSMGAKDEEACDAMLKAFINELG